MADELPPETEGDEVEALEIRLLIEAIRARYGYDLSGYAPKSLRRRVLVALRRSGCEHLGELQHLLLHDAGFFAEVLASLTVRVSEMFREPEQYRVLRERVLPILGTYPLLRFWHAGCAGGEEAYASAIMLSEVGLYERAQIYATDLSLEALEQAKQGIYRAESLQRFADNYALGGGSGDFDAYYTAAYGGLAMKPWLARNILFLQHDLVSDHVFGEMQVVFCRNVLIYFGDELRRRVIAKLVQSLAPGGFLCLGVSERLPREAGGEVVPFAAPGIYRHS